MSDEDNMKKAKKRTSKKNSTDDNEEDVDVSESSSTGGESETTTKEQPMDMPLTTIREVFSFAESPKTRIYLGLGLLAAAISGLVMPASILYFSKIMGNISAIAQEGLGPVLDIVYAFMILGVISLVVETLGCKWNKGKVGQPGYITLF